MSNLISQFLAARDRGVPVIAITTPDQSATTTALAQAQPTVFKWDWAGGFQPVNTAGDAAIKAMLDGKEPKMFLGKPADSLNILQQAPEGSVVVFHNVQRYLDNVAVAQAIANLRDSFKSSGRTLMLLAPSLTLPPELSNDVLMLDEPLPDDAAIQQLIQEIIKAAGVAGDGGQEIDFAIDALRGLSLFGAEQVFAMALSENGLDPDALWERKRKMIEATPGLSVWRGGETFKDIGGVEQVKTFMRRIITGRNQPRVIVFIDEIEKMLGGSSGPGGDTSGVSQDYLGSILRYMQDHNARGTIFVGPPGAAKSAVAKATGAEAGVPTIALDLGGMKGSLVGQSEERLRSALKVITAVGGDNALFIATCNGIATLPPELRRRFGLGTWFFDLPNREERQTIWELYFKKYDVSDIRQEFNDESWTGAEIRQCAMLARDLEISLAEASEYIVPVARAAKETIETLRRESDGRYLSASHPGVYTQRSAVETTPKKRALNVKK